MKILYLSMHPHIGYDDISGPGMHIREVIRGMEECGHEVIWVSANSKSEQSQNGEVRLHKASFKGVLKKLIHPVLWETLADMQLIRIDKQFDHELQLKIEAHQPDMIYERAY